MAQKTIVINGRFLTKPVSGVQRYGREILRHIDILLAGPTPDLRCVCLLPREGFDPPGWRNITIRQVGWNKGNLWEQIDLPVHARGELLFSPANSGPCCYPNQVVTIHDASVFAAPQAYSWAFRAKNTFLLNQLSQHARLILTDTQFSQRELAAYLPHSKGRPVVIPLGSDHLDRVRSDPQALQRWGLEKDAYLLVVASPGSHKNTGRLFEALRLAGLGIRVVLVGGSAEHVFAGSSPSALPSDVTALGYVGDEQLKALYENARALVFPSTYEGFGLPVLEAMRCGCPVLSSNAASLPEVAGEAALYFDPYHAGDLAGVLHDFLSVPKRSTELRAAGLLRAARFEWSATARQTLGLLVSLLEARDGTHSQPGASGSS